MDLIEKFIYDSISAQLKLDLPHYKDCDRAKYVKLIRVMLEDNWIIELEVNGGKHNFKHFLDNYSDKIFELKS